jgi:hypothetical protein
MFARVERRFAEWAHRRDERFVSKWAISGHVQPLRFSVMRGVVFFALPMLVGAWLIMFFGPGTDMPFVTRILAESSPIIILGGLLFGFVQWLIMEYYFRRLLTSTQLAARAVKESLPGPAFGRD